MNLTAQASSTARATTTPQGLMSAKRFANIRNAATSPTALPAPVVMTVGTTTSSPIPARAGVSAPRATHGAWWRRPGHLTDHVFPRLPVRQWVLSVPKRLRYFMQRDGAVLGMVLRIFLSAIAQILSANCPGGASADKATLHIGAVAFIHRFGSSLNGHVHFHVCVVYGVF